MLEFKLKKFERKVIHMFLSYKLIFDKSFHLNFNLKIISKFEISLFTVVRCLCF